MRTRTIETIIDRGFWFLVLVLPVVAYCIQLVHFQVDFASIMQQFYINDTNVIYTTLVAIFGTGGYLPFIDTSTTNVLLLYMCYFFCIELVHIIVDVLLFVPKICVNILDKYSQVGKI